MAFQSGGDRLRYGLAGALGNEKILAGRIDLQEDVLALGCDPEIDRAKLEVHLVH